jgi:hypothetical protein
MTEGNNTIWTIPALHEYFDRVTSDLEEKILTILKKDEESVKTAKDSMERRLDSMNEFRNQLKDQELTYLRKTEYNLNHQNITDKIENLSRIVWIGLGIWLVLQIILGAVIIFLFKK